MRTGKFLFVIWVEWFAQNFYYICILSFSTKFHYEMQLLFENISFVVRTAVLRSQKMLDSKAPFRALRSFSAKAKQTHNAKQNKKIYIKKKALQSSAAARSEQQFVCAFLGKIIHICVANRFSALTPTIRNGKWSGVTKRVSRIFKLTKNGSFLEYRAA